MAGFNEMQNRVKTKKYYYNFLLLLSALLITLCNLKPLYKSGFVIALFCMIYLKNRSTIKVDVFYCVNILMLLMVGYLCLTQITLLGTSRLLDSIGINIIIYFPIVVVLLLSGILRDQKLIVNTFIWFDILFSCVYILLIIVKGMPEERDSALGFVSSNYCAAVLYMTYPLILYYLKVNRLDKKEKKASYIALVLSMIMILTSGSRTAFGVAGVLFVSLLFLKDKNVYHKFSEIFGLVLILIAVYIAYLRIPVVASLIDRAMGALQGLGTDRRDVRTYIWELAFEIFEKYNHWIGSTSNKVVIFGIEEQGHNLFVELLLADGYFGVALYAMMLSVFLIYAFWKTNNYKKFFLLQLFALFFIVAFVQPFFTTNITCAIVIWLSAYVIKLNK